MAETIAPTGQDQEQEEDIRLLLAKLAGCRPREVSNLLVGYPDDFVVQVLARLAPATRLAALAALPRARRELAFAHASPANRRLWLENERYEEGTIGRIMEPAYGVFPPGATVAEAVSRLRLLTSKAMITYLYVADADDRFVGVVVMREMLLAKPTCPLGDIMLASIFALTPDQEVVEAMRETMMRHYPVYPVVDAERRLVGLVRGQVLFEAQTVVLSSQAGTMVGVQEEERLTTKWGRSLRFRHPWLQINLLSTFLAAAVVCGFEHTIARMAVLAAFMPVLVGQCANVGSQALAVAVRAMTLGELRPGRAKWLALKELNLGLANGFLTGLTAGLAMYLTAHWQGVPHAERLALVVVGAMTASCVISGFVGALTPVALKRLGFDPATASSIVLTTVTDVVSLGALLGLAAWLVPQ